MDHPSSASSIPEPTPAPSGGSLADDLFGPSTSNAQSSIAGQLPTISAQALLDNLVETRVLSESSIVSLLGPARKGTTIDKLEMMLVKGNVISPATLAEHVSTVSGRQTFENSELAAVPVLPADVARQAAAIAIGRSPSTVAFVADDPAAVALVAEALGTKHFDIWLMTAPTFIEQFKALYKNEANRQLPPVPPIYDVLDEMIRQDSSDLHLGVGEAPIIRVNGELARFETQPVDNEWMKQSVTALTGEDGMKIVEERWDVDRGYRYGDVKFRVNAGADMAGYTMAIRKLSTDAPTMEKLNLPPAVRAFTELERGLVLVTGPTGSGKSTTLAAILGHIGLNQPRHMITLEDPVEYEIPSRVGRVQQREAGRSFTTFADGIRQSLRQDPDVVLVGEARDLETIRAAVTAAETGALVFATLHTYDAASTIGRIISTFPEGEQAQIRAQLAYVLKGVLSQTLVKTLNGGRVGAFEILVGTNAVANNLRKPDGAVGIRQVIVTGSKHGMQTIEFHLAQLVKQGIISQADGEYKARSVDEFYQYLNATD